VPIEQGLLSTADFSKSGNFLLVGVLQKLLDGRMKITIREGEDYG
jgi:hypothetical protein